MRTASLMILGVVPSAAIGYVLLTGYILNKVRPLPITHVPNLASPDRPSVSAAVP